MATKVAPKTKVPEKARSAESIECSKQGDAKRLHGKPRKTFRSKCMKDVKKLEANKACSRRPKLNIVAP
jgi:psiF repeat